MYRETAAVSAMLSLRYIYVYIMLGEYFPLLILQEEPGTDPGDSSALFGAVLSLAVTGAPGNFWQ